MSNGTSGNTGAIRKDGKKYAPFEWIKVSGRLLAAETIKTIETIEHRADISLQVLQSELVLGVRKPDAQRIKWAQGVLAKPASQAGPQLDDCLCQRDLTPESLSAGRESIILQAIRLGDIAIAAAPCEVFAETGLAIKEPQSLPQNVHDRVGQRLWGLPAFARAAQAGRL